MPHEVFVEHASRRDLMLRRLTSKRQSYWMKSISLKIPRRFLCSNERRSNFYFLFCSHFSFVVLINCNNVVKMNKKNFFILYRLREYMIEIFWQNSFFVHLPTRWCSTIRHPRVTYRMNFLSFNLYTGHVFFSRNIESQGLKITRHSLTTTLTLCSIIYP